MSKNTCIRLLLCVGITIFLSGLVAFSQNAAGLQNLDILNIAKHIDATQIKFVKLVKGQLVANSEFKFVQLRDTETFILVPSDFQGRVVDLAAFLPQKSRSKVVLDTGEMTAKLICQFGAGLHQHCKHIRLAKNIIGCRNCQGVKWVSASVLSEIGIIIPPYKFR
ncbi:MAG: hypothetical protein HKN76_20235 [Saprospiraceae bacterium]|nr:hypothetical protein [Saprospiraceae bacterium]